MGGISESQADGYSSCLYSEAGCDDDVVMEEHSHQGLSDDESGPALDTVEAELDAGPPNPEIQTTIKPTPSRVTPSVPDLRARLNDQFGNTLKYTLATSALLSYNLSDAVPLYPASTPLDKPTAQINAPAGQPARQDTRKLAAVKPAEWGSDWHRRAESWQYRTPAENVFALGSWLVASVSSTLYNQPVEPNPQPTHRTAVPSSKPALPPAVLPSWHTQFLTKVDGLVRASHEFDLRTVRAVTGVKEVECIGWGLGL